ncbi:phage minor tail protein G [Buttiauxella selenatireducens]|uniref:Phage minor tail protein G n=1 Tax=Buttiauxella selenatireducens TaxID=3073902 RepID=A0ABY9SDC2_9ENTR|nr:phage minor tail protein G [Buttiauxella sp. R73]WMY75417.1 phage minor tail protein G [Buttiauxella sp. R73]
MFLKSAPFEFNGHTVTLYELSALQRIEHLKYFAELNKDLPDNVDEAEHYHLLVARNIHAGARLVAMSLWQADIAGPGVETLHQQVMSGWSPEMIGAAEFMVKKLSDMLPPDPVPVTDDNQAEQEDITAEKPTPVS